MKEELLIKFIKDECSPKEEAEVCDWVSQNPQNLKTFIDLKNLWISQSMPETRAEKADYEDFREVLKKKKSGIPKKYLWYSIAASIIILLALNLRYNIFQLNRGEENHEIQDNNAVKTEQNKNFLYTEKGVKAKITLPDGSMVWLNSDSRIIYPNSFSAKTREVEFAGEAFFDVVSDSLRPMIIRTNKNFRVEVLGTKFNIKSYDNDNSAQATLYSGSLRLVTKIGTKEVVSILKPNETFIIAENLARLKENKEDPKKDSAWKEGYLIFEATPLSEVIKVLERWHGTTFIVQDPKYMEGQITANFHSESIIQIMELLKFSLKFNYKIENNTVTIY
jgi:ferric-dicitrate binding protein FerR (iron transport regulator)